MSRIGKQPVQIPAGVTITVGEQFITVAGPKGSLEVPVQKFVVTKVEDGQIIVTRENDEEIEMSLGFSHPVKYKAPEGIELKTNKMEIIVSGIDKQKVGQVAAEIRAFKKPEPYKGKGIKYADEVILRKAGKAGKK